MSDYDYDIIDSKYYSSPCRLQIIRAVEDAALNNASLYQLFRFILQICYESGIEVSFMREIYEG